MLGLHPRGDGTVTVLAAGPVVDEAAPRVPVVPGPRPDHLVGVSGVGRPAPGVARRRLFEQDAAGSAVAFAGLRHPGADAALEALVAGHLGCLV